MSGLYRIRVLGLADGRPSGFDGAWLMSFDETDDGRGHVTVTRDPNAARMFSSAAEGWSYWQQTSSRRPVRADGKPNRPLTAYTVIVEPIGVR